MQKVRFLTLLVAVLLTAAIQFLSARGRMLFNKDTLRFVIVGDPEQFKAPTNFWYGAEGVGSYKMSENFPPIRISVESNTDSPIRIVSSRSHPSPKLELYLSRFDDYEIVNMGSSLKICLVADSSAHIYPRLGPTMEWDSGAGHAVLKFAGGELINRETGKELIYNKEILKNPDFICYGSKVKDVYEVL